MTGTLLRKLLRDIRVSLLVLMTLLGAFQCLWAKIVERVVSNLLPQLVWLGAGRQVTPKDIEKTIFEGPGKIVKSMIGGENVSLFRVTDMLTVGYVHSVVLTILALWAIGRASGALAGEIDRGTMELLLAQPIRRARIILAHLCVDLLTIPLLCLSLWAGNWIGIHLVGVHQGPKNIDSPLVDPLIFGPAQLMVAALVFAMSGYTMWISAIGRFRWRVLGAAVLITLLQYIVNVVAQLWDAIAVLRQFTIFYYYQPQQAILQGNYTVDLRALSGSSAVIGSVNGVIVLLAVGVVGYGMALWTFSRRDIPAPL